MFVVRLQVQAATAPASGSEESGRPGIEATQTHGYNRKTHSKYEGIEYESKPRSWLFEYENFHQSMLAGNGELLQMFSGRLWIFQLKKCGFHKFHRKQTLRKPFETSRAPL
jgi:hypothetical protein